MQILPVIDIMNGVAVRGVAGNRDQYRPLKSRYSETANPIDVATGIQNHFGLNEFYIADLDAIQNRKPNIDIYTQLVEQNLNLLLDAGISNIEELHEIHEKIPGTRVNYVIGLETLSSWSFLKHWNECLMQAHSLPNSSSVSFETQSTQTSTNNSIFSLDLKHGVPIESRIDEKLREPLRIVERAMDFGFRRIIVLDLAQVGTGQGVSTLELCAKIKSQYPECILITGGGIKTAEDLTPLREIGIDAALVATALYNGNLDESTILQHRIRKSIN